MNERSGLISKLLDDGEFRTSYIRSKINVNISSQIRSLRIKRFKTQRTLAEASAMKQSRISAMERPGALKFNLETLIRLASAFKVGILIKFVPYSEVLKWDNEFSQDTFDVKKIDEDLEFLNPSGGISETPMGFFKKSNFSDQAGCLDALKVITQEDISASYTGGCHTTLVRYI